MVGGLGMSRLDRSGHFISELSILEMGKAMVRQPEHLVVINGSSEAVRYHDHVAAPDDRSVDPGAL